MLACNSRIEEDLIHQLFNSSEAAGPHVVLLARYGKRDRPVGVVPKVSQETLGTARSRVNFFLNKFKRLASSSTSANALSRLIARWLRRSPRLISNALRTNSLTASDG